MEIAAIPKTSVYTSICKNKKTCCHYWAAATPPKVQCILTCPGTKNMLTLEFSVYGLLFDFQEKNKRVHTSVYRRPGGQAAKRSVYTNICGTQCMLSLLYTFAAQYTDRRPGRQAKSQSGGQAAYQCIRAFASKKEACCHYWVAASPPKVQCTRKCVRKNNNSQ